MKWGKHRSPSTQTEGLHTAGCRLVPGRESFTALLSLPQCHAAFSTIPSTLAWLDQKPL